MSFSDASSRRWGGIIASPLGSFRASEEFSAGELTSISMSRKPLLSSEYSLTFLKFHGNYAKGRCSIFHVATIGLLFETFSKGL
jgi:hypothetical protein